MSQYLSTYTPGGSMVGGQITLLEDFIGNGALSTEAAGSSLAVLLSGATDVVSPAANGVYSINTGTTANQFGMLYLAPHVAANIGDRVYFETKLKVDALDASVSLWAGLGTGGATPTDVPATALPTQYLSLHMVGLDTASWTATVDGAATTTKTGLGTLTAATYTTLAIDLVSGKSVKFFIDGVEVYTKHSGVPNDNWRFLIAIDNLGSTAGTVLDIDYVGFVGPRN